MRVTVLGSGGAGGTPTVDFGWGQCDPSDPRNHRLRPSILVQLGATSILVDTSPDLRQQLLNVGTNRLDAVFFTHFHADHLHGIDDLRSVNRAMKAPLDAYADAETLDVIGRRFDYVLEPLAEDAEFYYKPTLTPHLVRGGETFRVGEVETTTIEQDHGTCMSLGFRFGPIAYTTDLVDLPEYGFEVLAGVETWIIGTLVERPHPTHVHVDKALDWIGKVKPKRAILSHLSTRFDYGRFCERLPDGVEPAYDGMVIEA